jgi:hypothetical protein
VDGGSFPFSAELLTFEMNAFAGTISSEQSQTRQAEIGYVGLNSSRSNETDFVVFRHQVYNSPPVVFGRHGEIFDIGFG